MFKILGNPRFTPRGEMLQKDVYNPVHEYDKAFNRLYRYRGSPHFRQRGGFEILRHLNSAKQPVHRPSVMIPNTTKTPPLMKCANPLQICFSCCFVGISKLSMYPDQNAHKYPSHCDNSGTIATKPRMSRTRSTIPNHKSMIRTSRFNPETLSHRRLHVIGSSYRCSSLEL